MKRFYAYLLSLLLVGGQLFTADLCAQTTAPPTMPDVEPVYLKIQVAAYKNLQYAKLDSLFVIGKVYDEDAGGGIHRIVLGYYTDATVANQHLARVKKAGFKEAFITTHKGKLNPQVSRSLQPTAVQPGNPPPANTPAPAQANAPNTPQITVFVVELGTFTNIAEVKLGKVVRLGDLYVQETAGVTKIFLGPFKQKDQAISMLNTVKNEGFTEATIQEVIPNEDTDSRFSKLPDAQNTLPPTSTPTPTPEKPAQYHSDNTQNNPPADPISQRMSAPNNMEQPISPTDFAQLSGFFTEVKFNTFKINPYDPTQESSNAAAANPDEAAQNKSLQGSKLPKRFAHLFNNNQHSPLSFFALYRYAITPQFDGFIVRSGKGKYDQDNEINLFVFNKTAHKFTQKLLISSAQSNPDGFVLTEGWLMDLSQDDIPDLLNYTTLEVLTEQGNQLDRQTKFTAKVWLDDHFHDAQIKSEELLRKDLEIDR